MAEVRNRQRLIDERVALYRDLKSNFWDPRYRDPYFLVQNAPVGPESSQYGPIIVKHGVPLRDIIDVEQLVIKHELRKNGIEPGEIRIVLVGPLSTYSYPDYNYMAIGSDALDGPPENLYVMISHELAHFKQNRTGEIDIDEATRQAEAEDVHVRRPVEQEAIFWETQQAAKFGWGRDEYDAFVARLFPEREIARLDPIDQESLAIERQERAYAAMPVLSRRPPEAPRPHASSGLSDVHVRQHRRRA